MMYDIHVPIDKQDGKCTWWLQGNWQDCCCQHDIGCLIAEIKENPWRRLEADLQLARCVTMKGHPVIAVMMFVAVRVYAILQGFRYPERR